MRPDTGQEDSAYYRGDSDLLRCRLCGSLSNTGTLTIVVITQ